MGILSRNVPADDGLLRRIAGEKIVRRTETVVEREFLLVTCEHPASARSPGVPLCPHCGQQLPAPLSD